MQDDPCLFPVLRTEDRAATCLRVLAGLLCKNWSTFLIPADEDLTLFLQQHPLMLHRSCLFTDTRKSLKLEGP